MLEYTVVLLYPFEDEPESYIQTVSAIDAGTAVHAVRREAAEDNGEGWNPEDFWLIACFAGDCDLLLTERDQ